jgi:hypothetical protein
MKTNKFFSALTVLFLLVFLASCTSDNALIGPPGADGIDGVDGVDGTASCLACHNTQHRDSITDAYLISSHGSGTTFARGNSVSCARCHSNEGFVEVMETGLAQPRVAPEFPTRITCTTCHSDHDTFDFERDGQDFALRFKEDQVQLLVTDPSIVIDLEGSSNLCINCHQPRSLAPEDTDGDGMFTITSSRFGPHHGPQSMTLEGIQGFEIVGSTPYPGRATHPHRTISSCTTCHMGEPGDEVGTHTMKPNIVTCQQCHPGATDFDINGTRTEIASLLADLETRLADRGILSGSGNAVPGDYPFELAGVYWNRIYIVEDQTLGVHNYEYVKALLANSIEYLDNNPAPN